jgi:aspartokinase-like uncharacterized kinase
LMRRLGARGSGRLVIVPGGGEFADAVRAAQQRHTLSDAAAHRMALLAMHMVGAMLVEFAPGFVLAETVDEFAVAWRRELTPIWAPARMVLAASEIPASWDVTSDSLAAWLAHRLGAAKLVLVKSCPVPPEIARDAQALTEAEVVDRGFAGLVRGSGLSWHVVSGVDAALAECSLRCD